MIVDSISLLTEENLVFAARHFVGSVHIVSAFDRTVQ